MHTGCANGKYIRHLKYILPMPGKRRSHFCPSAPEEELVEKLDDFRFTQRFESRTEAIHWLLEFALNQNPKQRNTKPQPGAATLHFCMRNLR